MHLSSKKFLFYCDNSVDHLRQEHPLITMPRRPSTAASAVSLSKTQTTPYPLNRPLSRSTQGTGRPRTARPRTATSTIGNDTNVIAAVTEGPYHPIDANTQVVELLLQLECVSCHLKPANAFSVKYSRLHSEADYPDFRFSNIRQDNP